MEIIEEMLRYFPRTIAQILQNAMMDNPEIPFQEQLQEIRIRVGKPIILKLRKEDWVIGYTIGTQEMLQILEKLCENSIYAYKNQICEGFITIKGGHRVGITGSCVIENGKIINVKYISSLNFRVARQVFGCSNQILENIIQKEENTIFNTMIVSPPGKGKTTILRDTIRRISDGITELGFKGKTCGVVDERGEIAACFRGVPQNDVGLRTDVIENVSKSQGIRMLIRSMAPQIIACDEIGTKEDVQAIKLAICSGTKGIFTCHGNSLEDIKRNHAINELIEEKIVEKIIFI